MFHGNGYEKIGSTTLIKRLIQQDMTIVNIYAPKKRTRKYIKQAETKGESASNIIIGGNFNTPLISMNRIVQRENQQETLALNNTLGQTDSIDITYRTFHPKAAEYTLFSRVQGTFSRIDNMPGHRTSLNKLRSQKSHQESFLTTTL